MFPLISFNSVCSLALEISSEDILDGGFDILPDGNGNFFIASYDKNSTKSTIAYVDNTSETPAIKQLKFYNNNVSQNQIDYKYTTTNYYDACIYLTQIKNSDSTLEQYKIQIEKNLYALMTSTPVNGSKIESAKQTALGCNKNFFILANNNANSVTVCNSGKTINTSALSQSGKIFHTIATDTSKNYLYALDNSNNMHRYNITSDNFTFESPGSEINAQNFKFLTDNIFITSDGYICTLNSSEFKLDSKVKIATELKNYPTCVTSGFDEFSILAKTDDKIIARISCSDGAITGKLELDKNILAISTSGKKIITITGDGLPQNMTLINEKDITEITSPEKPNESDNSKDNPDDENKDTDNPEENSSNETDDDSITSDIHYINQENHVISEIPAGTTFGEFKNNLIFNGYSLVFKDANGNVKTGNSTKIGTGYTVTFAKNGIEKECFKLIVQGDLTGTGTLTSRDILAFVNYLLGKENLDSTYLQAANINDDNEPDAIDLFLMYKMLQK